MTKDFPLVFLRTILSLVVLYFAVMQLLQPEAWVLYIPSLLTASFDGVTLVLINALAELLLGLLLIVGIFTRIVAYLLSVHIFLIAVSIGFNPTGARDIGLAAALAYIGMIVNNTTRS